MAESYINLHVQGRIQDYLKGGGGGGGLDLDLGPTKVQAKKRGPELFKGSKFYLAQC